ncbi:MAG: sialate O-acetylesterase [Bacteroidales bacterium]|nr:sialate O-acetylesterase [Bacteroidales bacterium]
MKRLLFLALIISALSISGFAQDKNFYIYLCIGQSNMCGQAPFDSKDSIVSKRFLNMAACNDDDRKIGEWRSGVPPLCRRWSKLGPTDFFARTMVENLPENIKVGTIVVAVNGCASDLFHKDLYKAYIDSIKPEWQRNEVKKYDGNPLARLIECAKKAQKDGVIKGIIYHQGETDAYSEKWLIKMKEIYQNLLNELSLKAEDVPFLVGETIGSDQNGVCAHANPTIDKIHDYIPTAYPIASYGCKASEDNVHFSKEGYQRLGKRYAIKMLQLYGYDIPDDADSKLQSGTKILMPEISVKLSNKTVFVNSEVTLQKVDLVSYSGDKLKTIEIKNKKTLKISLKKYSEDRIILVFTTTDNQRIPKQINL